MPGTPEGGRKAVAKVKATHGADFYRKIGAKGGKISTGGGFASDRKKAAKAGAKGGKISGAVRRAKRDANIEYSDYWTLDN